MTNGHWVLLRDYRTPFYSLDKGAIGKRDPNTSNIWVFEKLNMTTGQMITSKDWFAFVESKPDAKQLLKAYRKG